MNFFKNFLSSCLGTVAGLFVCIFLIIAIISASSGSDSAVVESGSVLRLRLDIPLTELEAEDPLAGLIPGAAEQSAGLLQLLEAIRKAAADDHIEGIYLNTSSLPAGMAAVEEIREALAEFRAGGKWVVAYADDYSERAYLLASVADEVYLNPHGMVEFNGLASEVMFFKRALDKLEINAQVFRVGEFKSAVEPFIREDLSPENRRQITELLQGLEVGMISRISQSRGIDSARLRQISKNMLVRNAAQAVEYKLVDSLLYEDQVHGALRKRLGLDEDDRIPFLKYDDFRNTYKTGEDGKANEIAVIVADGEIMPGKGDAGVVGSSTIAEAFRRARKSEKVKAVVLRINSPGGSFTASDDMWREISLTAAKKPVIASMSDVAASGGYYLAMACDTIVARPGTITGSIGVFSVIFDLSGFLGNKLGITSQEVKTGAVGNPTVTRPLTDLEKSIFQTQTDEVYGIFTRKAAEGRHMNEEDLKKVAGGRVWTGDQAHGHGLVDVLGGFDEAVKIAAEAAAVGEDYHLDFYPKPKTILERLVEAGESQVWSDDPVGRLAGPEEKLLLQQWNRLQRYSGVQARMPFEFRVY